MINAILTGSRKYGIHKPDSDTDVVIFVDAATEANLWDFEEHFQDDGRIVFDQVKFVFREDGPVEVEVDEDGLTILCVMSEDDQGTLGGLHKWVRADKGSGFRTTLRNDNVNLVPVSCPDRWAIWRDGTAALVESGEGTTREEAIEFFTLLGMPRLDS